MTIKGKERAEMFRILHEAGWSYRAIGEMQNPPIGGQAVFNAIKKYLPVPGSKMGRITAIHGDDDRAFISVVDDRPWYSTKVKPRG